MTSCYYRGESVNGIQSPSSRCQPPPTAVEVFGNGPPSEEMFEQLVTQVAEYNAMRSMEKLETKPYSSDTQATIYIDIFVVKIFHGKALENC